MAATQKFEKSFPEGLIRIALEKVKDMLLERATWVKNWPELGYVTFLNDTGTGLSPGRGCVTLLNDSASLSRFLGVKKDFKNIYFLKL